MTLLVVGLVAVIVVILIAVFLSTRTGRGDDHEDARTRSSDRDRRHTEGERWRDRGSDARDGERGRSAGRASGRGGPGRHPGTREPAPAYSERPGRRRELPGTRPPDYEEPQRGPRRHDTDAGPGYDGTPSRRSAPARALSAGPSRYDSQPPPLADVDDFPVADYPSADFPAEEFPAAEPASVEFPAARATARSAPPKGRDAEQESRRRPARAAHSDGGSKGRSRPHRGRHDDDDDWPSTEWDKLSDEQYWAELSADKPVSSMNSPPPGSTSKPARVKNPAPAKNLPPRAAKLDPAQAEPRPAKPAVTSVPGREPGRELPGRQERTAPREAVTERLPVRPRPLRAPARAAIEAPRARRPAPQNPVPSNPVSSNPVPANPVPVSQAPSPPATSPQSTGEQGLAVLADLGTTTSTAPGVRDDDPLTSPSFSRKGASDTDSRSYRNARKNGAANTSLAGLDRDRKNGSGGAGGRHRAASQPADDQAGRVPLVAPPAQHPSGPYPIAPAASNGGHTAGQHPSAPYPAAPDPYPAAPAAANGYTAGQHPSGPYPSAPARHPATPYPAQQHPSAPYPVASHRGGGYPEDSTSPGSWYNMPAEAASLPGNEEPGVSYASYGAGSPRDYTAPDYTAPDYQGQPPPGYSDRGGANSHRALPVRGGRGEPTEPVSHPSFPGGQPGQEAYWDGHQGQAPYPAGYGNGDYADNHRSEPYQADGYGGYAARG